MIREGEFRNEFDIVLPPKFVVFCDLDGTLVDTDCANYLSYKKAVLEATHGMHNIQRSTERFDRKCLKKQLPFLTDAEYEEIARLKAENFTEFLSETVLNNMLANSIRKYSKTNETVLVTGCRAKRAIETLKYHKLLKSFNRLICWEALPKGDSSNKYENALSLVGVSSKEVLIFENDVTDVEKAVLSGVPIRNVVCASAATRVKKS